MKGVSWPSDHVAHVEYFVLWIDRGFVDEGDTLPNLKINRRKLLGGVASGTVSSLTVAHGAPDKSPAGFPASIAAIPFGAVSHWLQPWREFCYTRSLDEIEEGIGVVIAGLGPQQDALDMLRQQGFRKVRIEIGWGLVDPKTEARFLKQMDIVAFLARLRQANLRPLILLNANDGNPCPSISFNVEIAVDGPAGARSLTLASTAGLIPGRSGFAHLIKEPSGCPLVTEIAGQQVSLSKPLPIAIPAGTTVPFVTFNYEPFSGPGSPQNERTLAGWLRYVDLVCQTATSALGSSDEADRGFDLEIWNELTFGSRFLSINNYYDPKLLDYDTRLIWGELAQRTAGHVAAAAPNYRGVAVSDGFANTIPWNASSSEPPRVNAISKHPYPPHWQFPKDQNPKGVPLDAFGKKTDFVPSYRCFFPEHFANVIQTESMCRDLSDKTNIINGIKHGRLARIVNGTVSPVDVWITEMGCYLQEMGDGGSEQLERQATAFTVRSLFFYLGIGVSRVYLFEAFAGPGGFGLVDQATPTVPSLPLLTIARILSAIRGNSKIAPPRPLIPVTLTIFRDPADQHLFEGDGTSNLPPMTTADSVVFLPVQAVKNRLAILYYVMTRDIRVPLEPQNFKVSIQSASIQNLAVTSYDPITNTFLGVSNRSRSQDQVELELFATDMPRLLLFGSPS